MSTEHLSAHLKAIADHAAQLPPKRQDRLAAELDDALWDAQLRDPNHLTALRALAEEARQKRKLPMPKPSDTKDAHLIYPSDLCLLENAEGGE